MKNLYPKSNALKWCLTLIALCGIIYGCRKDHFTQTENRPPLTTINADIPELKSIYAKGIKSNALTTQSTGKWYNLIHSLDVDWDTYALQKRNDSIIVAEFNMKDDDALYTLKQLDNKYKNKTTVVFIKRKDGSRLSFFAKVIEDLSIPGSQSVINELHYQNIPGYFTGLIFYYNLDGQFVNGERYINGARVGSVTFNETTGGGVKINSVEVNNAPAPCTTTDFYSYHCQQQPDGHLSDCHYTYIGSVTVCDDDDSGGYGGGGEGGTPPGPPCIPPSNPNLANIVEVVKNGKLVIQNVPGPGIGGGDTTPTPGVPCPPTTPVPPPADIINNVKDPCLKAMVNTTINANVNTQVNNLIQSVFGGSTTINLTFIDVTNLSNVTDGYSPFNGNIVNGMMNAEVQLNANTLPHSFQEYIARVIMHEALHTYLDANNMLSRYQHEAMMVTYVSQMANSLHQMFPSLSIADAQSLAIGGLQSTPTFKNTIATDLGLLGNFDATNLAFSQGSKGTRCN